jgi:hypothetical protein
MLEHFVKASQKVSRDSHTALCDLSWTQVEKQKLESVENIPAF